jgi:hypothetical protein
MKSILKFYPLILFLILSVNVYAQLTVTGQLRTRSELRQGQGTLPEHGTDPAFFTSQRTRLTASYEMYRIKFHTTLQDVRVWGQDRSTVNRNTIDANDGILLHEAWAEIRLTDTNSLIDELTLKLGRQELAYNDHRVLGNLDWMQFGRRHDLALLKFSEKGWAMHLGLAYNQNKENKAGTIYNGTPSVSEGYPANYTAGTNGIGVMYKSMQFLWLNKNFRLLNTSLLLFKDDFNRYTVTGQSKLYGKGVWSRYTSGIILEPVILKKLNVHNSYYYQCGRDKDGNRLQAFLISLYTTYNLSSRFSFGPGFDFTSGNNELKSSSVNHAFDPLYGTPHKFWGYMDYFYVADGSGTGGLKDFYLKTKLKLSPRLSASLDLHEFYTGNKLAEKTAAGVKERNPRLGTEVDFLMVYTLTPAISFEGGYSLMAGTNTLDAIKSPSVNNKNTGHWAYLMIGIKPSAVLSVLNNKKS